MTEADLQRGAVKLRVLALDPATHTGWAHSSGASGTWNLSVRRDESAGMGLIRLLGKLNEVRNGAGVDLLVFEAARHAAPKMAGALVSQAEKQGVIKAWCEENGIQYRGYSPAEIKRVATGRGNAAKDAVFMAAREKWGIKVLSDDQADALWLLELALRDLGQDRGE